jgi:hypothetical protein
MSKADAGEDGAAASRHRADVQQHVMTTRNCLYGDPTQNKRINVRARRCLHKHVPLFLETRIQIGK